MSQNIAQRANKEDGEVGKFFQARCRAVRLLDETAILACEAYVGLNPIRAAIAETVEDSDFTSAQKRCCDVRAKCSVASVQCSVDEDGESAQDTRVVPLGDQSRQESRVGDTGNTVAASERTPRSSGHMAPVDLQGGSSTTGPCVHKRGARCSDKGFLRMSTAEYLTLLDWTARQTRSGKRGATPKQFAPLFDRLGISAEIWCRLVKDFGKLFSVVAGQPQRIDEHRSKASSRRYRTRQETRELLATV